MKMKIEKKKCLYIAFLIVMCIVLIFFWQKLKIKSNKSIGWEKIGENDWCYYNKKGV